MFQKCGYYRPLARLHGHGDALTGKTFLECVQPGMQPFGGML